MKKILILALLVVPLASPAMAEDYGKGRTKIGVILGSPVLVNAGFPLGKAAEFNILAGYAYSTNYWEVFQEGPLSTFNHIYAGANLLLHLLDVNFRWMDGEKIYSLISFGPQAAVSFGLDGNFRIDALVNARWEHTLSYPLNIFLEYGFGVGINFDNTIRNPILPPRFVATFGAGFRYVF